MYKYIITSKLYKVGNKHMYNITYVIKCIKK